MDISRLGICHLVGVIRVEKMPMTEEELRVIADTICQSLKLTVVNKNSYAFTPIGQTLVYILAQSHLSFHTWPEYSMIHVDLVSCKLIQKETFQTALENSFKEYHVKELVVQEYSF